MKTTRLIALAAAAAVSLSLFACSDDDSDDEITCKEGQSEKIEGGKVTGCIDNENVGRCKIDIATASVCDDTADYDKEECDDVEGDFTKGTSCPAGGEACTVEGDKWFIYGTSLSCDDLKEILAEEE